MHLADAQRSILVIIDLQGKLVDMVYRPELMKAANQRLMRFADLFDVPVILTEQYPQGLGPTHPEIRAEFDALKAAKRLVTKTTFGCAGDPGFEKALEEVRPGLKPSERQLIVGGLEAHVCVMQTVLVSLAAGSAVHVCWEAVSGRGTEYRQWALERMQQAGAVLTNHESVGFEWARDKNHPQFKAMSKILRQEQLTG
jgi:nicotinamidase-related amidase